MVIGEFIKQGNVFPNSLILALPDRTKVVNRKGSEIVRLEIPGKPEGIKIIGGQHRFFGTLASGTDTKLLCTFVRASELEQALMFAKVNGEQVRVDKSHLVSLFAIPGFVAELVDSVSEKQQKTVNKQFATFVALTRINDKGLLKDKLRLEPGGKDKDKLPYKTLFDTLQSISGSGYSGFGEFKGNISENGRTIGDILVKFFAAWEYVIGSADFQDLWMQPTMLSALLFTYPDIRRQAGKREVDRWLRSRKSYWKNWKPHSDAYLGMKGARRLGKAACRRLSFSSVYL